MERSTPIRIHGFPPLNFIPAESLDLAVVAIGVVPLRNKVEGLAVGPRHGGRSRPGPLPP